jgi:hypothetical protein
MYSSSWIVLGMDDTPGADDWMTDSNWNGDLTGGLTGSSKAAKVGVYEEMT